MPTDPTLSTTIRDSIAAAIASLHTGLPARIDSFTVGPPATVKVTICLEFHRRGADGVSRERYTPPQLANVPVEYPGAGGYGLTWPLAVGDYVWLRFSERSIGDWLRAGGVGVEPLHRRRHDLADAVAVPGIRPRSDDLAADRHDANALVLTVPGGKQIKLGKDATKGVNRKGDNVTAAAAIAANSVAVNLALTTIAAAVPVVFVTPPVITAGQVIGETGTGSSVVKASD